MLYVCRSERIGWAVAGRRPTRCCVAGQAATTIAATSLFPSQPVLTSHFLVSCLDHDHGNCCSRLGPPLNHSPSFTAPLTLLPLHPPLPTSSPMSDKAQAAAQSKSKHSHAASQAQPAPRKVRFNVGKLCLLVSQYMVVV